MKLWRDFFGTGCLTSGRFTCHSELTKFPASSDLTVRIADKPDRIAWAKFAVAAADTGRCAQVTAAAILHRILDAALMNFGFC